MKRERKNEEKGKRKRENKKKIKTKKYYSAECVFEGVLIDYFLIFCIL